MMDIFLRENNAIRFIEDDGASVCVLHKADGELREIERPSFVGDPLSYVWNGSAFEKSEEAKRTRMAEYIRAARETECFRYTDRSPMWFNGLTNEQKESVNAWYLAWLDAPETLVVPTRPDWIVQ